MERDIWQRTADGEFPRWREGLPRLPGNPQARRDAVMQGVMRLWHALLYPMPAEAPSWPPARWWAEWYRLQAEQWLKANRPDLHKTLRASEDLKAAQAQARKNQPAACLPYRD